MRVSNMSRLVILVAGLLMVPAWLWGFPPLLFLLIGVIIGGACAKYPQPVRRSEPPSEGEINAYHQWKNRVKGVGKVRSWCGWRVSHLVFPLTGVASGLRCAWWGLVVNVLASIMLGAAWRYAADRKADYRHPCRGVGVRSWWVHASTPIRVLMCVLLICVAVCSLLLPSGILFLSLGCILLLLGVWLADRKRQLAGWKRTVEAQKLIDSWTVKGMPLEKSMSGAYIVQADQVGDAKNPLTVWRVRINNGNTRAVKEGSMSVAPLAKQAGFGWSILLQARAHGVNSGFDSQCVRIVLGKDSHAVPNVSRPVDKRIANLVSDIAYQHTADLWRRAAPLTRVENVAADPGKQVAWKVELDFPVGATVDMHIVTRDWLIDPHVSPVSMMSNLPVYADVDEKFHLYAAEDTPLEERTARTVEEGRKVKTLMDAFQAVLPSKLAAPYPDVARQTVEQGDGFTVTTTPLQLAQGADLADYAQCDLHQINLDSMLVGVVRNRGEATLITVDSVESIYFDMLTGSSMANRLYLQTSVYTALCSLLKGRVAVGLPTLMGRGVSVWRLVVAFNGCTVSDVRKILPQARSMVGVKIMMVEPLNVDRCAIWLADNPVTVDTPVRRGVVEQFTRLWLVDSWATVGLVAKDGSGPRLVNVRPLSAGSRVLKARFALPEGRSMVNVESLLDKFLVVAGYQYGRLLPRGDEHGADLWDMILCDHNPLPQSVALPPTVNGMRFGVNDVGEPVSWDLAHTPHLSVMGKTGSGKSSVTRTLVLQALQAGWQVVVCDPSKNAADFDRWAHRLCVAWGVTMDDTEAAVGWVHSRMVERSRANSRFGVGNITDLPEEERPPRILLVFDEFNSYIATMGEKQMANPTNDMTIANLNAQIKNRVRSVTVTASRMADIAVQGRSLGVHMILGSQRLSRDDLRKVPNANAFYRSLGRLLLGSDSLVGVVTQNRLREANRMQKSLAGSHGIPPGRGVYEDVSGGLTVVQSYWDGGQDPLVDRVANLPDVTPADVSMFLPATAEHFGRVEESEPTPTPAVPEVADGQVESVDASGFTWNLDD